MERKRTSVFGIKGKLISAVAMLLVAVIMVVSSTYAWFTLSTAPEVRGIQTSIGANGALEIKLQGNVDGKIGETVIENTEYGNLIDLSDAAYGLDKIVLNPAVINMLSEGKINTNFLLGYASYNHDTIGDGRPGTIIANTATGIYTTENGFKVDSSKYGVRAIGLASGMTPEQIAYREAKGAANTAITLATTMAAQSLNANGSALANPVVAYALDKNSTFKKADVEALRNIVNSFLGTPAETEGDEAVAGILDYIEDAYVKQFIGLAASAKGNSTAYSAVKDFTKLTDFVVFDSSTSKYVFKSDISQHIPTQAEALLVGINAFFATKANAESADTALKVIENSDAYKATDADTSFSCTWEQFSKPLTYLINKEKVTVNNKTTDVIANDPNLLVNDVTGGLGINVQLNDEAGIYEEIADHCGNYTASIRLKVKYGTMDVETNAKMSTTSKEPTPAYLETAKSVLELAGAPTSETSTRVATITEFYGYVLDLIFRTNAAESNLLLQVDATDRIYEDNPADAITQGGGSYMTFTSGNSDFTPAMVANLMSFIRIVFYDTENGDIYGYAKLDTANYTVDAATQAVTAKMYMYKIADGYKYKTADGADAYCTVEMTYGDTLTGVYTDTDLKTVSNVSVDDLTEANGWKAETIEEGDKYVTYTKTTGDSTETVYASREVSYTFYKDADHNVEDTAAKAIWDTNAEKEDTDNTKVGFTALFTAVTNHDFKAIKLEKNGENTVEVADNVIVALPQNAENGTNVSTLVYLDGSVENGDVPSMGEVTGKMNLQFASSANLVPMDYGDLHKVGEETTKTPTNP